jgi:hypothetical protein
MMPLHQRLERPLVAGPQAHQQVSLLRERSAVPLNPGPGHIRNLLERPSSAGEDSRVVSVPLVVAGRFPTVPPITLLPIDRQVPVAAPRVDRTASQMSGAYRLNIPI